MILQRVCYGGILNVWEKTLRAVWTSTWSEVSLHPVNAHNSGIELKHPQTTQNQVGSIEWHNRVSRS